MDSDGIYHYKTQHKPVSPKRYGQTVTCPQCGFIGTVAERAGWQGVEHCPDVFCAVAKLPEDGNADWSIRGGLV